MLVIEGEGFVVIIDLRQIGVGEDVRENAPLAADLGFDFAIGFAFPATLPLLLVFPIFRVTNARLCFDVVEPGVFHALSVGPNVLARHRAGVTADALVEV